MAEEKKVIPASKPAETAEAKTDTTAPAAKAANAEAAKASTVTTKKTTAKKAPAKKPTAKKEAAKAPAKAAPMAKPAAAKAPVKAAPAAKAPVKAKAAPAKKPAAKKAVKEKAPEKNLDIITTALWNKLKKADVSKITKPTAIQVIVDDYGTFYIAVKPGDEKHIIQAVYYDRDGTFEASYEEMLKIAAGKYNFIENIMSGKIKYQGELKKAIELAEIYR